MEAYTYTPAMMLRNAASPSIKPKEISFGEASFKNFTVQEVFINGEDKGEYHIKIRNPTVNRIKDAAFFFTKKFLDCEVGMIDLSNALHLEHQIYVKTKDPLKTMSMMKTFELLDDTFSENMI